MSRPIGPVWLPLLLVWAVVAGAGAYAVQLRSHEVTPPRVAELGRLPEFVGNWAGSDIRFDARIYQVLSADTTLMRHYQQVDGASDVWMFVAYFHSQRTGAQIHSPKNCLPGGGWNILSSTPVPMRLAGSEVRITRFLIGAGTEREVVYYWFMTRAGLIHDEYALKLDLVRNALLRRPTDAAFVRLSGPVLPEGLEATDRATARFLEAISPDLLRALPFPAKEAF